MLSRAAQRIVMVLVTGLVFAPSSSFAHHAAAAFCEVGSVIELAGEVTEVPWANPHVRFTLRTDAGESWQVESNSVSILRRMDIGPELSHVGERLKVAGLPGRNGAKGMFVHNALLPDGEEVLMQPGAEPRWSDQTLGTSKVWLAGGTTTEGQTLGLFRVWSSMFGIGSNRASFWRSEYPLTAAAAAAYAAFDPIESNPLAYVLFMEDDIGTLEAGKSADLVVLDRDYMTIPVDDIRNVKPVMTVLGGKTVYAAQ